MSGWVGNRRSHEIGRAKILRKMFKSKCRCDELHSKRVRARVRVTPVQTVWLGLDLGLALPVLYVLHSKRQGRGGKRRKGYRQSNTCFQFGKSTHSQNANQVTDQENAERSGKCVLCSLTVAKHQGPCQNDRDWLPCLHILIGFTRTCLHQRANRL